MDPLNIEYHLLPLLGGKKHSSVLGSKTDHVREND